MSGENRKEEEFSREVDKIISGQEIPGEVLQNKDYGSELNFTSKIAEHRAAPSASFKSKLKSELLTKLANQEKKVSFWGRIRNTFATPVWRNAAVPIAVFAVALITMWGLGIFSHQTPVSLTTPPLTTGPSIMGTSPTETSTSPANLGNLEIWANLKRNYYMPSEQINIIVTFHNTTGEPVTLDRYPPEFSIVNSDNPGQVFKSFTAAKGTLTLQPGESETYTLVWDQIGDAESQVPPGNYQLAIGGNVISPVFTIGQ